MQIPTYKKKKKIFNNNNNIFVCVIKHLFLFSMILEHQCSRMTYKAF